MKVPKQTRMDANWVVRGLTVVPEIRDAMVGAEKIVDVLDGPEQECSPLPECVKGMTHDTCPYNPLLGCDCGYNRPRRIRSEGQ